MFDKWMNHVTNFNDYLYQGAKEIENVKCCGPKELIDKFDTQKFFREYGREHFLSISDTGKSVLHSNGDWC